MRIALIVLGFGSVRDGVILARNAKIYFKQLHFRCHIEAAYRETHLHLFQLVALSRNSERAFEVALVMLGFGCVHAGGDARRNCQNSL